jgi:hypothetical protein
MEFLLGTPPKERDMEWARRVCTTSRYLHVDVWRFCLKHDYVRKDVLPLLREARRKLRSLARRKDLEDGQGSKIREYVENDELRISNIEKNYLKGKKSAFVPDSMISMLESEAI